MDEEEVGTKNSKGSSFPMGIIIKLVLFVVALAIGGGVMYFTALKKPELIGLSKSDNQSQSEVASLLEELGTLISLPTDENPTIATVTDYEKLKEQSFFKSSQNGDKVIIYTNARKAILYRPSEKRIIEVGAVNINKQQPQAVVEEEADPTVEPSPTEVPTEEVTEAPVEE